MVITPTLPQGTEPRHTHAGGRHGSPARSIGSAEEQSSVAQSATPGQPFAAEANGNGSTSETALAQPATVSSLDAPIPDSESARQLTSLARAQMLSQSAVAMLAQGNLDPQTVMNLLQ